MGDDDPALGQHFFDVAKGKREPEIKPHRQPDDLRVESMPLAGQFLHHRAPKTDYKSGRA
jgi:hypothetical protein